MNTLPAEKAPLLAITGPTACGKTRLAVLAAKDLDGEIISADSRQVYRGMDIGTGKDLHEYAGIPHHLIDIVPAGYKYNLYEFLRDFSRARADIISRHRLPILCGGTGLYLESAISGLTPPRVAPDPALRQELESKSLPQLTAILSSLNGQPTPSAIDPEVSQLTSRRAIRAIEIALSSPQKISTLNSQQSASGTQLHSPVCVCIDVPRDIRRSRITERLQHRLDHEGMVDEVSRLLAQGVPADTLIAYGLEYRFITLYLTGQLTYHEMYTRLEIAIHQFAKRQMTWFRGMERRGFTLHHIPYDVSPDRFIQIIRSLITT